MGKQELEKTLPKHLDFRYKLAVKSIVVDHAAFDDVCLGCGINTEDEIHFLHTLLASFNYQMPAQQ